MKRSLEHKCSNFMFLSSFSVAKPCSTNRLLQYFVMMYMLSSENTLEESHWVMGTSQLGPLGGFFMNARNWEVSFVFLSDDVCPSSHIYWKPKVCLSSLNYLAMSCGGRGREGRDKKDWNGKLLQVLEKNGFRSICGSDENSTFPFCSDHGAQSAPGNRK